ncbi:hypothetical protein HC028_03420 [Planosporangium flavigriseum]|uniref:Uncharacterized protein n=1 Tax=Planosporangium flavigriseum TaxID=373681 RepID=A0A8J3LF50_9ACTN|nr:hypothetical protein [Planosporangium flavigriseum]NJC63565.1 hypothetical protein [Planosporangium flavigriseum]GIG72263.1 hypothetical protein Pfl04_06670 [Planosporangium flavigriseum]
MDLEHPGWCASRRCRAAIGGTHKSDAVEIIHGTSRASAWLQQQPADEAFLALVTTYHGISAPVAFLPLAKARALLGQAGGLITQAGDDEADPAVAGQLHDRFVGGSPPLPDGS